MYASAALHSLVSSAPGKRYVKKEDDGTVMIELDSTFHTKVWGVSIGYFMASPGLTGIASGTMGVKAYAMAEPDMMSGVGAWLLGLVFVVVGLWAGIAQFKREPEPIREPMPTPLALLLGGFCFGLGYLLIDGMTEGNPGMALTSPAIYLEHPWMFFATGVAQLGLVIGFLPIYIRRAAGL